MLQPLSSGQVGAARRPVPVRVLVVLAALVLAAATTACAGPPPVRPPASATPQLHLDGPLAGHDDTAAGAQLFPGPRPGAWELVGTLPHSPTSARVWDWAPGPASAAQVGLLARALGLAGTPARHHYGWLLSTTAGELRVRDGGGHQWAYVASSELACPQFGVDIDSQGNTSGIACAVATTHRSVPAPGPDVAATRAAVAPLLTALGLPGRSLRVSRGAPTSTASLDPFVAGLPTSGITTTIAVTAGGIVAATGRLDPPRESGTYPLRAAADAFKSLATGPVPMTNMYCGPVPVPRPGGHAPAPVPVCGPPRANKVTGAHIGLAFSYDAYGPAVGADVLVPAWFFDVAGSPDPTVVLAVAPAYLSPPVRPEPVEQPMLGGPGSPSPGMAASVDGS